MGRKGALRLKQILANRSRAELEEADAILLEHADAGEDSVGMEVAIRHLAPTLMDMTVEITVRVTSVDGRKVAFDVAVEDELDNVGAGSHTRFVVEKAKTLERLKAKAARFGAQKR